MSVDVKLPNRKRCTTIRNGGKIKRNDKCLCRSGKKWKKCCGKKIELIGCAEIG